MAVVPTPTLMLMLPPPAEVAGTHLVLVSRQAHADPVALAKAHDDRSVDVNGGRSKLPWYETVPLVAENTADAKRPFKCAGVGRVECQGRHVEEGKMDVLRHRSPTAQNHYRK